MKIFLGLKGQDHSARGSNPQIPSSRQFLSSNSQVSNYSSGFCFTKFGTCPAHYCMYCARDAVERHLELGGWRLEIIRLLTTLPR
jgi:hypothetical protein